MRRHNHACARRFLPTNDPYRSGGAWGPQERRDPPEPRTHEGIIADGLASATSNEPWDSDNHPRKSSGVDGECPLALVPLFNMVWDFCMDYMHLVKVLISGHLIPLLKCERTISKPMVSENLEQNAEKSR